MSHPSNTSTSDNHPFSLTLGISIALLASFIQSLGLTIQRKSHLQNESLPIIHRKPDYARPVWLLGFLIYFSFSILGSIFQIGTLPLIILGPLGSISLLWNAILARFLLGNPFSIHLVFGTILIGLGALLIGLFGVLPDQSDHHNLAQLVYLYSRTPFLIFIFVLVVTLSIVCSFAHYHESLLNQSSESISLLTISSTHNPSDPSDPSIQQPLSPIIHLELDQHDIQSPKSSTCQPSPHPLLDNSSPHHYPTYRPRSTSTPTHLRSTCPLSMSFSQQHSVALTDSHIPLTPTTNSYPKSSQSSFPASKRSQFTHHHHSPPPPQLKINNPAQNCLSVDRLTFMIGVAYGSTSGTLSGICLLFAKTGVELLIRTISGKENEFFKFQTWLILLVLLISAILQLWYLNKALRLVNPTLICPLAFCLYNLSTIISSLVYYDQFKLLSASQVIAISIGTSILLGGVWIVSNAPNHEPSKKMIKEMKGDLEDVQCEDEVAPLLRSSSRIEEWEDEEGDTENQATLSEEPVGMDESFERHYQLGYPNRFDHTATCQIHDRDRPRRSLQLGFRSSTTTHSHPFDHLIRQFVVDGHVTPAREFGFVSGAAFPAFSIRPKRKNNWISQSFGRTTDRSSNFNSYPTCRRQINQQQDGAGEAQ